MSLDALTSRADAPRAATSRDYPRMLIAPPGPKARAIVERQTRWSSTSYPKEYPLAVARAEGAMVEDVDGNRFLDFMGGIAVAATGHAHPTVVAAIREAAGRFLHICGSDFYYDGFAALCERLAALAPGTSPKRVFLTNSGAEAVESAIKLARHSTRRPALVAFTGAFHGRTYGAMSLTASKVRQREGFGPFLPEVYHVPYADPFRCEHGRGAKGCTAECARFIESDLFARRIAPGDVAAIFVEPVQGEGGYIVPPRGWLRALRDLCDRHGILLVADEVQCGVGRTGRMFACEYEGVEPDILTTAKGLGSGMPIGAIVMKESIMRWQAGAHGSTFGGNPVCCAAALATLDIVERDLLPQVPAMGERLIAGMRRLAERHRVIGDVRGLGLMIGVELVKDRETREPAPEVVTALVRAAFSRGLLLLGAGKSTLRLAPPLVIDAVDVDTALGIIDECLAEVSRAA
jgi:4-aminobutyrate aminotransferase